MFPVSTPSAVEDSNYILHLSLLFFRPLRNIINLSQIHYSFLISFLINCSKFNIIKQNSYLGGFFSPSLRVLKMDSQNDLLNGVLMTNPTKISMVKAKLHPKFLFLFERAKIKVKIYFYPIWPYNLVIW